MRTVKKCYVIEIYAAIIWKAEKAPAQFLYG